MNVNQVLFVLEEIGKECRASEMRIHGVQIRETDIPKADILLSSRRILLMAGLLTRICFNHSGTPELSELISKGFGEEDAKRILAALEAEAKKAS